MQFVNFLMNRDFKFTLKNTGKCYNNLFKKPHHLYLGLYTDQSWFQTIFEKSQIYAAYYEVNLKILKIIVIFA